MTLRSATAVTAGYVNRVSNNWSAPTTHCIANPAKHAEANINVSNTLAGSGDPIGITCHP